MISCPADLVSALSQLASQLSGVQAQVQSRELCAAASVMATVSTLSGTEALRRAAPTLGPAGTDLAAALPAPESLPDRRENNGRVLRSPGSGKGEFTVDNGTDHDAVVTLSQAGKAVRYFYVAHHGTARMANIPDGTYDVFFTSGTDWDGGVFTRSCTFQRFDSTAQFATTKTRRGINYTTFAATLHAVPEGTVQIISVSPDSFPK